MARKNAFLKETEIYRDLRVLEEIEKNPKVSQRELADNLGVALGIANACIHTLVRKGMIKIRGDNNRSVTYHLTKKGLLHKSVLAIEWTKNTVEFYWQARQHIAHMLKLLAQHGPHQLLLLGADEQVEIATIVAHEAGVEIKGVIKREKTYFKDMVGGIPVADIRFFLDQEFDAIAVLGEVSASELKKLKKHLEKAEKRVDIYDLNELPLAEQARKNRELAKSKT